MPKPSIAEAVPGRYPQFPNQILYLMTVNRQPQRHFQAVTGGGGSPMFQAITDAKGMYEVAEAFELGKYYKEVTKSSTPCTP